MSGSIQQVGVGPGLSRSVSEGVTGVIEDLEGLITAFSEEKISREEAIGLSLRLSERLEIECKGHPKGISMAREGHAMLLKLPIGEVELMPINALVSLTSLKSLKFDMDNWQFGPLFGLEKRVREEVSRRLEGGDRQSLLGLLSVYENILEHLWLMRHLFPSQIIPHDLYVEKLPEITRALRGWIQYAQQHRPEDMEGMGGAKRGVERFGIEVPAKLRLAFARVKEELGGPFARNTLGDLYQRLRDYQRAEYYYKMSLASVGSEYNRGESTVHTQIRDSSFIELGHVYQFLGRYDEAVEVNKKAVVACTRAGDAKSAMKVKFNLAVLYNITESFAKAVPIFEELLPIAERQRDQKMISFIYGNLGNSYIGLRNYEKGIELQKKRFKLSGEFGDLGGQIKASCNLAKAYHEIHAYADAERECRWALNVAERSQDRSGEAFICGNLANALSGQRKFDESIRFHLRCKRVSLSIRDFANAAMASTNLGMVYRDSFRYHDAIRAFEESLQIAHHLRNQMEVGETLIRIGNCYRDWGKTDLAHKTYEKLRKLAEVNHQRGWCIRANSGLATLYGSLGQNERAFEYFRKNLELVDEADPQKGDALAFSNIGVHYRTHDQIEKAIEYFEKGLEVAKKIDDRFSEGRICSQLATLLFEERKDNLRDGDIVRLFNRAILLAQETDDKLGIRKLKFTQGLFLFNCGRTGEAIENITDAIRFARLIHDQSGLAHSLNALGGIFCIQKRFEEADRYFHESIQEYRTLRKELGAKDEWKITSFEEQVAPFINLEMSLMMQEKPKEALAISEARRALSLVDILNKEREAAGASPTHLEASEIQRLASQQKTSIITFSMTPVSWNTREAFVWVVNPDGGIHTHRIPLDALFENSSELEKLMNGELFSTAKRNLRSLYVLPEVDELTRGRRNPAAAKARAFKKKLQAWHATLITPIKEHLPKGAKLTIIPDGFLSQLPFAIFMDEEGKYLIEDHPISIAPSLQVLKLLQERKATRDSAEGSLVVGNPEAGIEAAELPMAQEEAMRLKEILRTPDERMFIREQAKVSDVTNGMKRAKYIHLACHGEQDLKTNIHSVFEGAFLMSPDEGHANGLLYAEEIGKLKVKADLVFLSACKSGKGAIKREGTIGPMRSFLAAGANSVVGTLWSLPDSELTVEMVTGFYERVLGGTAKDEALREVMLMAIERKRNSPHAWGAFVLTGLAD